MTDEEFDLEFPVGSQKRQEELNRLEHAAKDVPVPEPAPVNDPVPESIWRAPSA